MGSRARQVWSEAGPSWDHGDDPRAEAGLPQAIGDLIGRGAVRVRAVDSPGRWFGLTHAGDRPKVVAALRELDERGEYPSPLWNS